MGGGAWDVLEHLQDSAERRQSSRFWRIWGELPARVIRLVDAYGAVKPRGRDAQAVWGALTDLARATPHECAELGEEMPLHYAVRNDMRASAQRLLRFGAVREDKNQQGQRAEDLAVGGCVSLFSASEEPAERLPDRAKVLLAPYPGDPHEWVFFHRPWTDATRAASWMAKPVQLESEHVEPEAWRPLGRL